MNDELGMITPNEWEKAVHHVKGVEQAYWTKDGMTDWEVNPLVIPLADSDDDEDVCEYDNDEDASSEYLHNENIALDCDDDRDYEY